MNNKIDWTDENIATWLKNDLERYGGYGDITRGYTSEYTDIIFEHDFDDDWKELDRRTNFDFEETDRQTDAKFERVFILADIHPDDYYKIRKGMTDEAFEYYLAAAEFLDDNEPGDNLFIKLEYQETKYLDRITQF